MYCYLFTAHPTSSMLVVAMTSGSLRAYIAEDALGEIPREQAARTEWIRASLKLKTFLDYKRTDMYTRILVDTCT